MKHRIWLAGTLAVLLWAAPARAQNRFIVRTTNLQALQLVCNPPLLAAVCNVVPGGLGDPPGQLFQVTSALDLNGLLNLLRGVLGFVGAEVDQVLNLVGSLNLVPSPLDPALMSDRTLVAYPANSSTMVWNSYVMQPAASVVEIQNAQSQFNVTGAGIVADIDTGVDPTHPALQGVLLQGYDFTRNQPGGSEMTDVSGLQAPSCTTTCPSAAQVNQSSAAILDQSSAAILDKNTQYSAFGHGTMVMGIIHLVAPTAQLLPLKAFKSNGTANLSDILRAIYYAAQNNANVINMSFDTKTASTELQNALDYANQLGLISVASAGNDGMAETVYPAALQSDVMGVASVGSTIATEGTRSSFSNFGNAIVWVAAPGEQIITTYPYSTYAAGWGTSFSAPFVSGGAALLRSVKTAIKESEAATATAHAAALTDAGMGNGRLDLVPALQSLTGVTGSPDFTVSSAPASATIAAGQSASYTLSAAPAHGFNQKIDWSCTGAPQGATCTVSPSSVTLDGNHAATATITLTTTARAFTAPLELPRYLPPARPLVMLTAAFACLVGLMMLWYASRVSRQRPSLAAAVGLLAVSLLTYSCGGGYGGPPPGSPTISSLTLNPTSVNAGSPSTGTVTLSGPAPSYGAAVSLSSNASAATVPASVTVPAGSTSATFAVSTNTVSASTPVTITASYGSSTKTAMFTITPASTGTPAGTYTLTVTGASGNLSHSTVFQVIVN
jgi:hypothetical protein